MKPNVDEGIRGALLRELSPDGRGPLRLAKLFETACFIAPVDVAHHGIALDPPRRPLLAVLASAFSARPLSASCPST